MKVNIRNVSSDVLGTCPASVDMGTGVISINRSVWDRYDNFEKAFILFHEIGHYELNTDSEYEADAYALNHVYRTAPRSLKRSLQTLCKIGVLDAQRLERLFEECLRLDANDGNRVAQLELINITNNKITGKMTNRTANQTYVNRRNNNHKTVNAIRYATGEEPATNKSHKTNGLRLGEYYVSFTNLLLIFLIFVVIWRTK